MVIDSSALLSIFYLENDAEAISAAVDHAQRVFISAPTLVEAWVTVLRRKGEQSAAEFELMVKSLLIEVVEFSEEDAVLACEAYARFGKGRHEARLNLGDCFSYALAKRLGEPLLFKGDDFVSTDVLKA